RACSHPQRVPVAVAGKPSQPCDATVVLRLLLVRTPQHHASGKAPGVAGVPRPRGSARESTWHRTVPVQGRTMQQQAFRLVARVGGREFATLVRERPILIGSAPEADFVLG